MELHKEFLRINEQLGDLQGKSAALHDMVHIYRIRGDLTRAMELCQKVLAINEQLGDLQGKSVTRAMWGQPLAAAGAKALALQDFVQALAYACQYWCA
jgi:hypothetical protein